MHLDNFTLIIPTFDSETGKDLEDTIFDLYNPNEARDAVEMCMVLIKELTEELEVIDNSNDFFVSASKN